MRTNSIAISFSTLLVTGTTLLCFLVFANTTTVVEVGRYAVYLAVVGLSVRSVDSLCTYCIVDYLGPQSSGQSGAEAHTSGSLVARMVVHACCLILVLIPFSLHGYSFLPAFAYGLSQAFFLTIQARRVFASNGWLVMRLAVFNGLVSLLLVAYLLHHDGQTAEGFLGLSALCFLVICTPFVRAELASAKGRGTASLRSILFSAGRGIRSLKVLGFQALNTVTASADVWLAASISLVLVGELQVLSRPLLVLGTLNAVVGAISLNRIASGSLSNTVGNRKRAQVCLCICLVILVWPGLALAVAGILPMVFPNIATPAPMVVAVFGFGYALGGIAQVTGVRLLARSNLNHLLVSAFAQCTTFLLVGFACLHFVPTLMTIAVAFVASRASVLVVHALAFASGQSQLLSREDAYEKSA